MPLTPKVFDILVVLVENGGRLVEKDDLMRRVWPNTFVEEGNLTQNISLLRKALGEGPNGVQFIETVPRRGYRFVAPTRKFRGDQVSDALAMTSADSTLTAELPKTSPAYIEPPAGSDRNRTNSVQKAVEAPAHEASLSVFKTRTPGSGSSCFED